MVTIDLEFITIGIHHFWGAAVWMKRDMHIFSKLGSKNIESSISERVQNRTRWIITLDYVALLLSCVEGGEAPKIDSICFGHGQVCSEIAKERGRYWHAWKIDVL